MNWELICLLCMIFSHRDRVVIEINGKQHYAVEDKP